jgi:drug/metabolite transporter (DMT)-like permease
VYINVVLQLVKQMGSHKATYVVPVYPIIALILSTVFEGYQWHLQVFIGVVIVLLGNAVAMGKLPLPFAHKI